MNALALLVAGGLGERLARTHPERPKALLEVGGVALLDRNLERLFAAGLNDIWIAVGHRFEEIAAHLKMRRISAEPRPEMIVEAQPLGTIGALASLPEPAKPALVVNADLLSAIDLRALLAVHETRAADLTIATHFEEHRLKLGEVAVDAEDRVTAYLEKPVKRFRISSGTYVVGARARALLVAGEPCAFPTLVERALARKLAVVHHDHGAPWLDVNDADDLAAAERLLAAERARFAK
jgi:NDP-sugar pyrophosphorylase family protein